MKSLMPLTVGIAILASVVGTGLHAESLPPGQVDFGKFSASGSGREFVEVNLSSSLISLAARFVEKEEPEVARLLNSVQLVRVNVIGLDDENRAELEKKTQKIRKELEGKGWERIVTAQKQDQDVGVYLKTQGKDTVQGIVVLVTESNRQAVFVNIVGDIKPEQLALLGEKLHIDPLKNVGHAKDKAEEPEKTEKADK